MEIGVAAVYSVLGLCTVFVALALIMVMTSLLRKFGGEKPAAPAAPAAAAAAPAAAIPAPVGDMTAPGSGTVQVAGIDAKTAALLMAVVAEEMHLPLNQIKFTSIKEM